MIGANGLGKTTLVTLLYRMLTGPYDLPGLADRGDLGNIRPEPIPLRPKSRGMFANRVVDRARNAIARLTVKLGPNSVVLERRLRDLSLTMFVVDENRLPPEEKESFQIQIPRLAGISTFFDWILLLRHLTFYFEDRKALVWDSSAQRQILRFLFLSPDSARKWTQDERAILMLDSKTRNFSAVLFQAQHKLEEYEQKTADSAAVRTELTTLQDLQEVATLKREQLESELIEVDEVRQQARLRLLTVEQERETRYREFERAKLISIEARYPTLSETARFILAQLLTQDECLACGNTVPEVAARYSSRIDRMRCVICGTDLSASERLITAPELADKRVKRAASGLGKLDKELSEATRGLEVEDRRYRLLDSDLTRVSIEITTRSERIETLINRLPPEDAALHEQHSEISIMRSRLAVWRQELKSKRDAFRDFIGEMNLKLVEHAEEIKTAFNEAARDFLLEDCRLVWSPQRYRLGETGTLIDFPAFALDMTGADFSSPVRRTGPEQVSESQREFIDVAFRIALMEVASFDGPGSLVIDAPESSLDAVFVDRASTALSQFSVRSPNNRLIITSNLVEGSLIPGLIQKTLERGAGFEVVDLLEIAAPTAAVREQKDEYARVRDKLLRPGTSI